MRASLVLVSCVLLSPALAEEQGDGLPWEDARRFAEALEIIRQQYAEPVDDATLIDHAIRGMANGLDPYSTYLAPDEYAQARISAAGRYEGIGVEVVPGDAGYVIVTPLPGGPAEKAGLRSGDILLGADGRSLSALSPAEFDASLAGPAGSEVRVTVQRGEEPPFDVLLRRAHVNIPSVTGERLRDGIAYVRIAHFSDRSAQDLQETMAAIEQGGAVRGLVIDLRNNAGGVVDGAVHAADAFIERGVIVSTQGRAAGQSNGYAATPGAPFGHLPTVVLVNGGTASAAEIFAGALKDHGIATAVGARTFGKGAVQTLLPLDGGGALKLTTATYRTPAGTEIEGEGIAIDVPVPAANETPAPNAMEDDVVRRALDVIDAMAASGETRE